MNSIILRLCPSSLFGLLVCLSPISTLAVDGAAKDPGVVQPLLLDRLALTDKHHAYLRNNVQQEVAPLLLDLRMKLGVSNRIGEGDYAYYMQAGTNPGVLYEFIAEVGITKEENDELANIGVDLRQPRVTDINGYHRAAMADTVVQGVVAEVIGNPDGPYHSTVVVDVSNYLKTCHDSDKAVPSMRFHLVESGPHRVGNTIGYLYPSSEPQFKAGEKVVIVGGRNPINFRAMTMNLIMNNSLDGSSKSYGTKSAILERASRNDPEVIEVYQGYKVVGSNLVLKSHAFRVPQETDVMPLSRFEAQVAAIARAQGSFCKTRARRLEAEAQSANAPSPAKAE